MIGRTAHHPLATVAAAYARRSMGQRSDLDLVVDAILVDAYGEDEQTPPS